MAKRQTSLRLRNSGLYGDVLLSPSNENTSRVDVWPPGGAGSSHAARTLPSTACVRPDDAGREPRCADSRDGSAALGTRLL